VWRFGGGGTTSQYLLYKMKKWIETKPVSEKYVIM
jgi:hypothetical protein